MDFLKVEKPRFLFLEGSAGAVAAADVATVALQMPPRRAPAPPRRTPPLP
jgi:hypothetical protein